VFGSETFPEENVVIVELCGRPNLDGAECTRHRTPGEVTCWWHHPDRIEERAQKLEAQAALLRASA
jgi:hypothetical protein